MFKKVKPPKKCREELAHNVYDCVKCVHYNNVPAVPSTGLYFTLDGTVYLPGDTVLISDIGAAGTGSLVAEAGTSLVCETANLGIVCCRGSDGNRAGDWFFPDGTIVPASSANREADFTRTGYTQQVRLNRRNDAMTPTGAFECRVLDGDGVTQIASITLGLATTGVS